MGAVDFDVFLYSCKYYYTHACFIARMYMSGSSLAFEHTSTSLRENVEQSPIMLEALLTSRMARRLKNHSPTVAVCSCSSEECLGHFETMFLREHLGNKILDAYVG